MVTDFIGRRRELEILEEFLAKASGGCPQVVLIEGDPGVGKTAMLAAFRANHIDLSPIDAAGDETEIGLAFGVVDQIMGERTRREGTDDPFTAGAALLRLLSERQSHEPATLIVDDAHLVDCESLQAMTFALRRLRVDRVLAVLAIRPQKIGRLPAGLVRLADSRGGHLVLSGLSEAEVIQLGIGMGCGRLPQRAAARLRRHTAGSPLHLRALMREMSFAELQAPDGPLPAPRSFALLVLGALAQTSPTAQRLAGAAAILGLRSRPEDVAVVADVAEPLHDLEELHHAGTLHLSRAGHGWWAEFGHPLIRAAVYDDLGPATRAEMHIRAAECIGGPQALAHRVAAAVAPDPQLSALLVRQAQEHQHAKNWHAAAEALLDASQVSPPGPHADRRLLDGVEQLLLTGDVAAAQSFAGRMAAMEISAHRLQIQARLAWLAGRFDESEKLARQAWVRGAELQPAQRDGIAAMLTQICLMRGDGRRAAEWAGEALASGLLTADEAITTRAGGAMGLMISGRPAEGLQELTGLPSDPLAVDPQGLDALHARGSMRLWTDDLAGARADLSVSASAAHRGTSPYRLVSMAYLAETDYRLGDWDSSAAIAEQAVSLAHDMDQIWLLSLLHSIAVLVLAGRGQWTEAQHHVDAARRYAHAMDTPSNRAYAENASVHLAACQADSAGVIKQAETWLTAGTGAQHEPGLLGWQVQHVSALIDLHRLDDASVTLEGLEQLANHRQRRSQQAGLARVRGELESAGRRTRAARQAFDTALSLGGSSSALERAIANASYGRFLRRRGERRAAARLLQTASEGFHRLGAQPFLDRCTVETAACGLTPNRRSDGYSATLTPQEQTVARLVCTGLTNQQVADELVLSVKTIDYHLAHVYTKLDVHSRTQLMANIVRTSTSGRSRGQSPETPASSGEKPGEIPEVASHPLA